MVRKLVSRAISFLILLPVLTVLAVLSRLFSRAIDAGFGPEPLINHVLHIKALKQKGWTAESYVSTVYYITQNFDYRIDHWRMPLLFKNAWLFVRALFRYKCLFIYFNGGPLGFTHLWRWEPWLLKLAGIKTVVMPYGSDVQYMGHCPNLLYKQVFADQYFNFQRAYNEVVPQKIDMWCANADHILCGCDWVDYVPYWKTLVGAHFTVEMKDKKTLPWQKGQPLRLFHATNHPVIKGTKFIEEAVAELRREGYSIELDLLKNVPNHEVLQKMEAAHLVIDQVLIGWYGLFSLEAMANGKPVICYLRPDLVKMHRAAGTFVGEVPIISSEFDHLKTTLKSILDGEVNLSRLSEVSYDWVKANHSVEAMANVFDKMIKDAGVQ